MRVDRYLWTAASVAILLALASLLWMLYAQSPRHTYAAGDKITELPEIRFGDATQTVVLWINTRCQPCNDSIPFYRRLRQRAKHTHVVAVGPEPASVLKEFLADGGLSVSQVVSVGRRAVPLWFTPTLLTVDGHAVVTSVYVGAARRFEDEQKILSRID